MEFASLCLGVNKKGDAFIGNVKSNSQIDKDGYFTEDEPYKWLMLPITTNADKNGVSKDKPGSSGKWVQAHCKTGYRVLGGSCKSSVTMQYNAPNGNRD